MWISITVVSALVIAVISLIMSIIAVCNSPSSSINDEFVKGKQLDANVSLTTDRITAEFYATIYICEMNPIEFVENEWKRITSSNNQSQLFFLQDLQHGVTINEINKIRFHKEGRWSYQFELLFENMSENPVVLGASISEEKPKLANGFGCCSSSSVDFTVSGSGFVVVEDVDVLFQIWSQNMSANNTAVRLRDGQISLKHIGE
jgi:ribosome-binding factor A